MEKRDFARLENLCQIRFSEAGCCFHVCSQENHPVLFHNDAEFKAAMNIIAFVALLFRDVVVFTFEIMSNHLHFALSGDRSRIIRFLHVLVLKMSADPVLESSSADIEKLMFNIIPIESLDNMRNVISYINRNGFVVNPDHSPFSYPWGANRYFFNPEAKMRVLGCGHKATCAAKRELFHSDKLAKTGDVIILDGYVSPLSYCHIGEAEVLFRTCWHYFQSISRNIESAKDIAKAIGEGIFYNDDELYSAVGSICSKEYGMPSAVTLPKEEKLKLAKKLHFDYNASNKQISRVLKLDVDVVNLLFPTKNG